MSIENGTKYFTNEADNKTAEMIGWKPGFKSPYSYETEEYFARSWINLDQTYGSQQIVNSLKAKNPDTPDSILIQATIENNNIKAGILQRKDAVALPLVKMPFDFQKNGPVLIGAAALGLVVVMLMKKKK
jgi:hypothetical protein